MRTLKLVFSSLIIITTLTACKEKNRKPKEGNYIGTFTVKYSSGTKSGPVSIELKNSKYSCTKNPNRIPAGGSGTYSIDDGKISFQDENSWTADFDWNLILRGEYDYTFDGKKLNISAQKNNVGYYEYNLEKN